MSVYLDPISPCVPSKRWRWSHSAHLFADTIYELHAFADRIGLKKLWFKDREYFPHYDLTSRKHAAAVRAGAIQLDRAAAVKKWREIVLNAE